MNRYILVFTLIFTIISSTSATITQDAIHINSDKLTINKKDMSASFTGCVLIEFEDRKLKTDSIKIYYKQENNKRTIDKIIIPKKFVITKNKSKEIVIADNGEYIKSENKLVLKGNVVLYKEGDVIITDKAVYFIKIKHINYEDAK